MPIGKQKIYSGPKTLSEQAVKGELELCWFYVEIDTLIVNFTWKHKGLTLAKTTLKKNQTGWSNATWFQNDFKATVIKTVGYWCKDRQNRSVEQKKDFRNRPTHICTTEFQYNVKWINSTNGVRTIRYPRLHTKKWTWILPHRKHKS